MDADSKPDFFFDKIEPAMPTLRVPTRFKYYQNNQTEVSVPGETVAAALDGLTTQYPLLRSHLFDSSGKLRRHINLFVNSDNMRDLQGLETPLQAGDVIKILPSITGG